MELLLEDSEVNLRQILRNASRRGGRIFEIFNSKEKSEHSVECKVRWDERWRLKTVQEERARRDVQEVDDEVDQNWTATCEWIAKKNVEVCGGQRSLDVQRKHKLINWEGERERARTLRRLESSRAMGQWSGVHDNSSFGSCSSSLAFHPRRSNVWYL